MVDLSGRHGILTGASSDIGLAVAKALLQQKIDVQLIGRGLEKLENSFTNKNHDSKFKQVKRNR